MKVSYYQSKRVILLTGSLLTEEIWKKMEIVTFKYMLKISRKKKEKALTSSAV